MAKQTYYYFSVQISTTFVTFVTLSAFTLPAQFADLGLLALLLAY